MGARRPNPKIREEYAAKGYGSIRRIEAAGQGEMFPEADTRPPFRELPSWGGPGGLSAKQKQSAAQRTHSTLGQATSRAGSFLDAAFERSAKQRKYEAEVLGDPDAKEAERTGAPIHAAGARFYTGAPGTEGAALSHIAQAHGVPLHVAAGVRASLAQNMHYEDENPATEAVLSSAQTGRPPRMASGKKVPAYGRNLAAAQHIAASPSNADPLDLSHPKSASPDAKAIPGYKPPGFYQSFVYPNEDRARTATDRWMFRSLAPKMSDEQISRAQGSLGHTNTQGVVAPAHRLIDEATHRAAADRGLAPSEAQSIIWHEARTRAARANLSTQFAQQKLF